MNVRSILLSAILVLIVGAAPVQADIALLYMATTTGSQGAGNGIGAVMPSPSVLNCPAPCFTTPNSDGPGPTYTYTLTVTGTGAVSATVNVEGAAHAGDDWKIIRTLTASGTNSATAIMSSTKMYSYFRGNVTAISGTGASVMLTVSPWE